MFLHSSPVNCQIFLTIACVHIQVVKLINYIMMLRRRRRRRRVGGGGEQKKTKNSDNKINTATTTIHEYGYIEQRI